MKRHIQANKGVRLREREMETKMDKGESERDSERVRETERAISSN